MKIIQNFVLIPHQQQGGGLNGIPISSQPQYLKLPQDHLSQQCDDPTGRQDKVKIHKTFVMYSLVVMYSSNST